MNDKTLTSNLNPPDFRELELLSGRRHNCNVLIIYRTLSNSVDANIIIVLGEKRPIL